MDFDEDFSIFATKGLFASPQSAMKIFMNTLLMNFTVCVL